MLLGTPAALACSVPVFRFALEQWPPSRYEVLVYHRGTMTDHQKQQLSRVRSASDSTNATVVPIDLDMKTTDDHGAIWSRHGVGVDIPFVIVRYPDAGPKIAPAWTGSLESAAQSPIFDSPARRALFDRLTAGHAGVVVLLRSGDDSADDALRARLENELPRFAAAIELPARTPEGPQIQSNLPLRLNFPLVEVRRHTEERAFVRQLLGSEDGLESVRGPIVFVVFGRGRALCSVHGNSLKKSDELQRALEFLCRACSCQVKELNPGLDLLMAAQWESIFTAEAGPMPRLIPTAAETRLAKSGGPTRAEMRSAPPDGNRADEVDTSARNTGQSGWRRTATIVAVALFLATGVWVLRSRRAPPAERL